MVEPEKIDPFAKAFDCAMLCASRAPSSHNCQPWGLAAVDSAPSRSGFARVHDCGDHSTRHFVLALDGRRAIRALPAHDAEMIVSCGAFLHLIARSFAVAGWRTAAYPWPEGDASSRIDRLPADWRPLAAVCVGPDKLGHTVTAPGERRRATNRSSYCEEPLPPELLEELARCQPGFSIEAPPSKLAIVNERAEVERLARFVAQVASRELRHAAAWSETYHFLRFDEPGEDGIPVEHLFGPMSLAGRKMWQGFLSPAAMVVLRLTPLPEALSRALGARVARSPALAVFSFDVDEAAPSIGAMLAGGGRIADFWLRATDRGLSLHPVSVVVQYDDLRRRLRAALETAAAVETAGRPFFFTRLGRPTASPALRPTPRRAHMNCFATI